MATARRDIPVFEPFRSSRSGEVNQPHPERPIESQRIALHRKIVLRFHDFDGFATEYSANLSMTGMFVRSRDPHPPGTPVRFEFKLTDGLELIKGTGWVVWVREKEVDPSMPAGMGVEFTEISADSRRLIRWVVLHQLPEGVVPFELSNFDNRGAFVASSTAKGGASGRSVAFGLVAGLILFAAGAGTLTLIRPSAGEAQPTATADNSSIASVPVESGEETKGVSVDDGSAGSGGSAVEARQSAEDLQAVEAAIEGAVRDWAGAWSRRDVEGYLRFYAEDFVPADGTSREAWETQRYERLTRPGRILVALTSMETEIIDREEARVTFTQTYRSDSFSDIVRKTLDLRQTPQGWKIHREQATAS